jgi:hypothetical protein
LQSAKRTSEELPSTGLCNEESVGHKKKASVKALNTQAKKMTEAKRNVLGETRTLDLWMAKLVKQTHHNLI